jgi:hypothetical protein
VPSHRISQPGDYAPPADSPVRQPRWVQTWKLRRQLAGATTVLAQPAPGPEARSARRAYIADRLKGRARSLAYELVDIRRLERIFVLVIGRDPEFDGPPFAAPALREGQRGPWFVCIGDDHKGRMIDAAAHAALELGNRRSSFVVCRRRLEIQAAVWPGHAIDALARVGDPAAACPSVASARLTRTSNRAWLPLSIVG